MPRNQTTTGAGRTQAQHSFAIAPQAAIQRSVFNRSCGIKTSFDSGDLVPIFVDEALPGDTMSLRLSSFTRMQTPIRAPFERLYQDVFFFSVPCRILWENWEKFNGAQDDPGDSTSFTVPQFTNVTVAENSLSDYMGLPLSAGLTFNSLHHRAYNMIFREWFRDEDLTDSPVVDLDDGPDNLADYVVRKRAKRHDYFSACRPFVQKGTAVDLPLGTTAPVEATGDFRLTDGSSTSSIDSDGGANAILRNTTTLTGAVGLDYADGLQVDLSTATAATINELRTAFQTQRLLERDARGGTRYAEILRSHFGVLDPQHAVLQRPEYLGGGSSTIELNIVPSTANVGVIYQSTVGNPVGYYTGAGQAGFTKSFTEHCVVIGLVNVRADLTYQQGVPRMFSRQDRFDFYLPVLAHLGEQAVLNQEIFFANNPGTGASQDQGTFGYQERWAEYRYKPSQVTGTMRSDAATPLDVYHLALDFASLPSLNNTFIEDQPPISRIVNVTDEPEFFFDGFFQFKHARPMPTYSVPGLIDHF